MPLYEYQCPACQSQFEEFVRKVGDMPTATCHTCGETAAKIMSASAFAFGTPTMTRDGNSGVYAVDSKVDQVVGRDAEKRRMVVEAEKVKKTKVRRETGASFLSKDHQGEYHPVPEAVRTARDALAESVNKSVKEQGGWDAHSSV